MIIKICVIITTGVIIFGLGYCMGAIGTLNELEEWLKRGMR